ncbi:MAG TPA: T9SS type A sorting domain-containing protein [Patescibacteria group bacterium]|nr:T9SS type A sorting domain-containing protein [Patescibacteria group bacterium]
MFKRLLSMCVAVAALLMAAPTQPANAQTVVTVGNQNYNSYMYPYSMYYFYTKIYSAQLYNSTVLTTANGGSAPIGLISRLEWRTAQEDVYYRNWYADKGQTVKIYMGISPTAQWPSTTLPAWPQFISGQGNTALQNVQLVYEGKGFTSTLPYNSWEGFDLQNRYLYTGGNLVVAVQIDKPEGQYAWPDYVYEYGFWKSTYLAGDAPNGTNRTNAYWYGYNGWDQSAIAGYDASYYGRPDIRLHVLSGIEASFPDDVDPRRILRAGYIYDGSSSSFPRPSLTFRTSPGEVELTYRIQSVATGQTIYTATDNGNPNDTIINLTYTTSGLVTHNFTTAKGIAVGTNGALDLTNINGGAYRLIASYRTPSSGYNQQWMKEFNIAFERDLSIRQITAPYPSTDARQFKYPRGTPIPVQARFQNVGLDNITSFRAVARVYNQQNVMVYVDTVNFSGSLATGDVATIDFANFATLNVGDYRISICGYLLSGQDQQFGNDCMPTAGNTYTFTVQYGVEAEATSIIRPNSTDNTTYYAGRPIVPFAVFTNKGIEDLSDIPATMTITRSGTTVYTSNIIVSDIARNASANGTFESFTPPGPGSYQACVSINHEDDAISTNNSVCASFNVSGALEGTYTIGSQNSGSQRNFATFQDAANALYSAGVTGPVVFELTDANYVVGNSSVNGYALDLRSTIIGVNATNTITFRPSQARSASRASVTVQLRSGNGIGIALGESYFPSNLNAVYNQAKSHSYANATGYITFDGGTQKSLRFTLESNAAQRAVFYLGNESNNTMIRNVIIENSPNSTASYNSSLPRVIFSQSDLTFTYEGDVRTPSSGPVQTYSAAIVIRNIPTLRSNLQTISVGVADTNTSDNNRVVGNEISGFGFGVVGIGIGPLYKPTQGRFDRYYMKGLEIRDNLIQNISRAGIFVANTEGAEITGNRIAGVGVASTGVAGEASGIRTGGEASYNNMNMRIGRNEISGITSASFARGIAVEQVEQEFLTGTNAVYRFPDAGGRNKTTGNIVWGVNRTAGAGYAAGIHYFTQRSAAQTGINQMVTPQRVRFFTTQDTIAGNTVIMQNDSQTGTGIVAGIGVQQARAAVVMNNAIAVLGGSTTATTANTALLIQGMANQKIRTGAQAGQMTQNAVMSDRNAFWTPNATIARFIQVDDQSRMVSMGTYDEYTTLTQWRQGASQDLSSVYGDWTSDYEYRGTAPLQMLRVKANPAPIGSILNNRGERMANLGMDIDNEVRGAAGQRPDIGGDEFNGRLYVNDIESVEIIRPGSYRSQTGNFRDAEYIMTQAPVSVTVRLRNGGSIAQADAPVTLRIYAETAGSAQMNPIPQEATYSQSPVLTQTLRTNMPAGESVDVEFSNLNFTPQTYAQMGMASTIPAQFATMAQNVTPRYRIEIETISDENNSNNITGKDVRFYLVKSPIRMLASVTGSTVSLTSSTSQNDIAGRLNTDTLRMALRALGWDNNGTNVGVYDLFDRGSWEPRAVDYTPYRTLVWADDTTRLTMTERMDLSNYVYSGSITNKKNLAMSTQEVARKHVGFEPVNDEGFVRNVLRAQYVSPGTPFNPNYDGRRVIGMAIAEATADFVRSTGVTGDAAPVPALLRVYSDATTEGLARAAYKYETRSTGVLDSIMGVASTATYANVVYLGVDWRHYARTQNSSRSGAERVLRGVMDFFEKNGGTVVPVELAGGLQGEARRSDNQWTVDLWWKVASEVNVADYSVERAELTARGLGEFTSVTSKAPGMVDYLVTDRTVEAGRTYVYRLRSTDLDGTSSLSNIVEVSTGDQQAAQTMTLAPMPVMNASTLEYALSTEGAVEFIIFDAQGAEVMRFTEGNRQAGTHTAQLNASALASGAYTVQLNINGTSAATLKFSVLK